MRYVQALNDTERTQTEVWAEHREVGVEERRRPTDLGHDEHNGLEDDQQSIHDGPESTRWLVRYCTPPTERLSNSSKHESGRVNVLNVITLTIRTILC